MPRRQFIGDIVDYGVQARRPFDCINDVTVDFKHDSLTESCAVLDTCSGRAYERHAFLQALGCLEHSRRQFLDGIDRKPPLTAQGVSRGEARRKFVRVHARLRDSDGVGLAIHAARRIVIGQKLTDESWIGTLAMEEDVMEPVRSAFLCGPDSLVDVVAVVAVDHEPFPTELGTVAPVHRGASLSD
jgi:hypothetical protein